MTGYNTLFIDDRDPFAHGFEVKDRARQKPAAE
jgi:4-hydroxyproline epimerase